MKKYLIYSLILFLTIPVVAIAQNKQNSGLKAVSGASDQEVPISVYNDMKKERDDYKKECEKLEKKLDDLQKKLDKQGSTSSNDKENLKKIKHERDSLIKVIKKFADVQNEAKKAMDLKQTVDSLNKVIAGMQADRQKLVNGKTAEMQQVIDSLNRELVAVRQTQDLATSENTQQKQTIEQLDKELQELEIFKRDYIDNLAEVYNRNWASKLFSQIDGDELGAVITDCQRYAAQDKRVATALANLNELNEQFMVYKAGKKCLESIYNYDNVDNIRGQVKKSLTKISSIRKSEMEDLHKLINLYQGSVSAFKLLINNIDKTAKEYDTHDEAYNMITIDLVDKKNAEYIKSIEQIPWLKGQYEIYMKQLEKDCKAKNEVHDLILGLSII